MKISGSKFEAARLASGLTRSEIAVAIGQTHVRVWQLGTEETSNVNQLVGEKLAELCKVEVGDLV